MEHILDHYKITMDYVLWIEVKPVSVFRDNEVEDGYVDNGRADIVTKKLDTPFQYEGKNIVGYTFYDKYLYGRENKTTKKFAFTLYHSENEDVNQPELH